jgi:hypothetical protein
MNAFRDRASRYLGLSSSARQADLPGSSRSRLGNVPGLYAVFSAPWAFLAVAEWLLYAHRPSPGRLLTPIGFSAMAIAFLVLCAVERRKRRSRGGSAMERPDLNTLDGSGTRAK